MTRGRWIVALCVAASLTVAGALAYKRWPQLFRKANTPQSTTTTSSHNQNALSALPPFSTKEPEIYQATRIVTSVEYQGNSSGTPVTVSNTTRIARDGDKRREEYVSGADGTMVLLETPAGRFVLLPDRKLYADLNSAPDRLVDSAVPGEFAEAFSTDRLLNETQASARYENLGAAAINGRMATSYRVTREALATSANENGAGSVTLIWIDDELGLPVRSETNSSANGHTVKQTVELREVKQTIDVGVFELPRDYRKVDYSRLFSVLPQPVAGPATEKAKPNKP